MPRGDIAKLPLRTPVHLERPNTMRKIYARPSQVRHHKGPIATRSLRINANPSELPLPPLLIPQLPPPTHQRTHLFIASPIWIPLTSMEIRHEIAFLIKT